MEYNVKCLCGKGKAHFHIDRWGHRHSWLSCPDCARKYHVTQNGLLPRNIPLKYPNSNTAKQIKREEKYLHEKAPWYSFQDWRHFMTEEEINIVYENRDDGLWLTRPFHDDKSWKIIHGVHLMSEWAYLYTKRQLLILHDTIDDSIYTPESDKFLRQYRGRSVSEEEIVALLRRTIIDYEKHIPFQEKWKQEQQERERNLLHLRDKLRLEHEQIEELWKTAVIRWDQLEAIE